MVDMDTETWLTLPMTNRSNAFNHYTITIDGGETYADKCRDSFGGYVNLCKRIATRQGISGIYTRLTSTDDQGGCTFILDGTTITGSIKLEAR